MTKFLYIVGAWWRRLPQKTRVQLIASVLLVFTGTEVIVLAPYVFDIALMIDVGGMIVVIAALRSSVSVSLMQLRACAAVLAKPFLLVLRLGEIAGAFGTEFPRRWYHSYLLVDRFATRCSAGFLVAALGLRLTCALMGHQ